MEVFITYIRTFKFEAFSSRDGDQVAYGIVVSDRSVYRVRVKGLVGNLLITAKAAASFLKELITRCIKIFQLECPSIGYRLHPTLRLHILPRSVLDKGIVLTVDCISQSLVVARFIERLGGSKINLFLFLIQML